RFPGRLPGLQRQRRSFQQIGDEMLKTLPPTGAGREKGGRGRISMTKKPTWQELLNIPNILTYFRFLFIPVFIWQYLHENYWLAGLALGLSALTDLLDGKIARKFDMITEIGILLDPVADKLTEAAVLLCLALRFPLLWAVLAICLCKEGFMAVAGAVMLRRKKKLGGAMWFGKVCTTVFYLVTLV